MGHLLRAQGYYTAFKGKWHLSEVTRCEDALERYGFCDYQQWGEMFGAPLQGAQLDGAAAFETVDWLERKRTELGQPWLLVCSLVNPHDVMFLQTDPVETPDETGAIAGLQTPPQKLGWFEQEWDVKLPDNFADDYAQQPDAVRRYKEFVDRNYGAIPDDRTDLWLARRNYLINAMRLVDREFMTVIEALDRLDLWKDTVVIFTGDHGEMNCAHRMTQKGAIHFDEAAVVNFTVCAPGAARGRRSRAVGSHLDLVPTLLDFAGLSQDEMRARYPHLKGRSLRGAVLEPAGDGPRGSQDAPGDGALLCWDGLHSLDLEWALTGALSELTDMSVVEAEPDPDPERTRRERLHATGEKYGAPDFSRRTFYRAIVDGRYKLVRWFSPEDYGNPSTLEELYATADVTLHDLVNDPGEMENLAHPAHPRHDPQVIAAMLAKLHALVAREIGDDVAPFDLDMFGTRSVTYRSRQGTSSAEKRQRQRRRAQPTK